MNSNERITVGLLGIELTLQHARCMGETFGSLPRKVLPFSSIEDSTEDRKRISRGDSARENLLVRLLAVVCSAGSEGEA